MIENINKVGKFLLTRTGVALVFLLFILSLFCNTDEALTTARLKTLNRVMPPLKYLTELNRGEHQIDTNLLEKYLHYYNTVNEYLPDSPDTFDLLGYIHARLGNSSEAMEYYRKSIQLNPNFFWSHYNLGILYLHNAQYEDAAKEFITALQQKPETAILIFSSSKVYQQIFAQLENPAEEIKQGMTVGYRDCYRLLVLSKQLAESPAQLNISFDFYNAPLFIF